MIKPCFTNIRKAIIDSLNEVNYEILVAVYWFTNDELFSLLCDKLREGKKVSLIVHNDYINNRETGLRFQTFIDLGGQFFFSDSEKPMHNKFCVIDEMILINGSYNWTYYAENRNSENILIIKDDQAAISAFRQEFVSLTQRLKPTKKIQKLTTYEIEEFNSLNATEYLANDIIYQAKATNRPELVDTAFKLSPNNIRVQESAVKLDLTKKWKLNYSIGAELKDNRYLIGVEKGTTLPVNISRVVETSEDNQTSCYSALCYGENDVASMNKQMTRISKNQQKGGVVVRGIPPKAKGEAKLKMIFTIDIYGQLKVKFYSLDNGNFDEYLTDVKMLVGESI